MELFRIPPSNEGTQPVTAADRDRKGTGMNVPSLGCSQGGAVVCENEGPFTRRQIFFLKPYMEKACLHEAAFKNILVHAGKD